MMLNLNQVNVMNLIRVTSGVLAGLLVVSLQATDDTQGDLVIHPAIGLTFGSVPVSNTSSLSDPFEIVAFLPPGFTRGIFVDGNEKVGIGTNSPNARLQISGSHGTGNFNDLIDSQLSRLLPDARRVVIDDAGHEMFLDNPHDTNQAIIHSLTP